VGCQTRHGIPVLALIAVAALTLAGCGDADAGRLQDEARADLARYADAVASSGGASGFQPAGELTGQVGNWELAVGSNNKMALYGGLVEAAQPLSSSQPPDGTITWADGTMSTVTLLSAAAALDQMRVTATGGCIGCDPTPAPLRVTGATLTRVSIGTSRGQATVPAWAFTIEGTAVQATRVAVAQTVTVVPPAWDPSHPRIGLSIMSADLAANGVTLTFSFVGSPYPASQGCGEDYTGEAIESDLAVVAVVHVQKNPIPGSCAAVGASRTATATLATPLGSRAVLEVQQGLPVPVTRQ
jgi:hypothetical protein